MRHDYRPWHRQKLNAARHDLKRIGDILGPRRQLDVCLAMSEKYGLEAANLQVKRQHEGRRINRLMLKRGATVARRLEKLSLLLTLEPPLLLTRRHSSNLRKRLRKWQESAPKSNRDFHKLRIFVKKVTYIFAARDQHSDKKIVSFQKLLGQTHDLEVIEEMLELNRKIDLDRKKCRAKTIKKQRKVLRLISDELRR